MSKKFTCVDLFSGAGGLSRGFYDAGYDVVLGVDFDEAALKTFRENLTDRTIAFDQLNLDTLKIKNKVVHLIVSNVTNDQNYLKVQESLTTLLDTSNSLSLDRQQKFNLVNGLSKTLNNMAKLLDEPPVFQRLNDFFTRFEKRVDDLVLGDGLKLYGIEPQNLNKTNERGQSFDM